MLKGIRTIIQVYLCVAFWIIMNAIAIPLAFILNCIQDLLWLISPKLTLWFNRGVIAVYSKLVKEDEEDDE